ncbi:unnamed protein product [Owenia fusiformis]|uniref:Uncharacterized protein n=1 Tax=Owenia fusiformis TaxID=6347 RepID=A0A8J1Y7H6_OWEFU|nr:unnamed protein product [Owenia fusiformis]
MFLAFQPTLSKANPGLSGNVELDKACGAGAQTIGTNDIPNGANAKQVGANAQTISTNTQSSERIDNNAFESAFETCNIIDVTDNAIDDGSDKIIAFKHRRDDDIDANEWVRSEVEKSEVISATADTSSIVSSPIVSKFSKHVAFSGKKHDTNEVKPFSENIQTTSVPLKINKPREKDDTGITKHPTGYSSQKVNSSTLSQKQRSKLKKKTGVHARDMAVIVEGNAESVNQIDELQNTAALHESDSDNLKVADQNVKHDESQVEKIKEPRQTLEMQENIQETTSDQFKTNNEKLSNNEDIKNVPNPTEKTWYKRLCNPLTAAATVAIVSVAMFYMFPEDTDLLTWLQRK